MTRLLVVEDAEALRRALRLGLRAQGYEVAECADGESALARAAGTPLDLMLLDLGLPGVGGLEVLRRLRRFSAVPVVVLTARDRQADKVAALDAGADDYVTKPFDSAELLARIRAALRRGSPATSTAVVVAGDVEFDLVGRTVRKAGAAVRLTRIELALLTELATNPERLLTHDQLLSAVWGPAVAGQSHYLRVYVGNLRRKLGDDAAAPRLILTEPGIGYRWIGTAVPAS